MLISLPFDYKLLPRYVNWSAIFRSLSIRVVMIPFRLKYMYMYGFYLRSRRGQCPLVLAFSYALSILLVQVNLGEVLNHALRFYGIFSALCFFNVKRIYFI